MNTFKVWFLKHVRELKVLFFAKDMNVNESPNAISKLQCCRKPGEIVNV